MSRKLNMILLIAAALVLCSCSSHETLKAPCSPIAGLEGSPCTHERVNLARL